MRVVFPLVKSLAIFNIYLLFLVACGASGDDSGGDGGSDSCFVNSDCSENQVCVADHCQAPGTQGADAPCSASRDCGVGLFCGSDGRCQKAGSGKDGDFCSSGAQCQKQRICFYEGLVGQCRDVGNGDLGDSCESTVDCISGLGCTNTKTCNRPEIAFPPMSDVTCKEDTEAFRVLFEIPRDSTSSNYFSLPFPSDIRMVENSLNVEGFPFYESVFPGLTLEGKELFKNSVLGGFSCNIPVTFRFSKELDYDSLGGGAVLHYVDVTPDAP